MVCRLNGALATTVSITASPKPVPVPWSPSADCTEMFIARRMAGSAAPVVAAIPTAIASSAMGMSSLQVGVIPRSLLCAYLPSAEALPTPSSVPSAAPAPPSKSVERR